MFNGLRRTLRDVRRILSSWSVGSVDKRRVRGFDASRPCSKGDYAVSCRRVCEAPFQRSLGYAASVAVLRRVTHSSGISLTKLSLLPRGAANDLFVCDDCVAVAIAGWIAFYPTCRLGTS